MKGKDVMKIKVVLFIIAALVVAGLLYRRPAVQSAVQDVQRASCRNRALEDFSKRGRDDLDAMRRGEGGSPFTFYCSTAAREKSTIWVGCLDVIKELLALGLETSCFVESKEEKVRVAFTYADFGTSEDEISRLYAEGIRLTLGSRILQTVYSSKKLYANNLWAECSTHDFGAEVESEIAQANELKTELQSFEGFGPDDGENGERVMRRHVKTSTTELRDLVDLRHTNCALWMMRWLIDFPEQGRQDELRPTHLVAQITIDRDKMPKDRLAKDAELLSDTNLTRMARVAYGRWISAKVRTFRANRRDWRVTYPDSKTRASDITDLLAEAHLTLADVGTSRSELTKLIGFDPSNLTATAPVIGAN